MRINRPALRYFGGKWLAGDWIVRNLPPHECYVEPFGGAASVLLKKPESPIEVYNDLDSDVVNFFQVLREQPTALIEQIRLTPFARAEQRQSKKRDDTLSQLERARRMYVDSWQSFGMLATGGGWRFMSELKRSTIPAHDWVKVDHLYAIAERFSQVQIESDDAVKVIARFDSPTTLFYVDPPYMHETRTVTAGYRHEIDAAKHEELLTALNGVAGSVVLSGYDSDLYNDMLTGWERIERQIQTNATDARKATEVLWIKRLSDNNTQMEIFEAIATCEKGD